MENTQDALGASLARLSHVFAFKLSLKLYNH